MVKPRRELSFYVERYWGWKSQTRITLPVLLPGTGMELMFHLGVPFGICSSKSSTYQAPSAHYLCLRSLPFTLKAQGPIDFLAVRFRAGAFRHFCNIPLQELSDTASRIETVWGKSGRTLACKIRAAKTLKERIESLETYLLDSLFRYGRKKSHVDLAVKQLYDQHDRIKIHCSSDQLRMSRRHFERTFQSAVGLNPKLFQRLSRFQQTVRELLLAKTFDYLPVALAHGYYDQSHFIKEFQFFTQQAPSSFLTVKNLLSHFYNTKLRS